jgi:putative FmdB family regulatory protein
MPLYVYSCSACEIYVEELRPLGMADWPPVECPVCKGLCEQDVTTVTIGGQARPMSGFTPRPDRAAADPRHIEDPVAVLHGPSCPCCR